MPEKSTNNMDKPLKVCLDKIIGQPPAQYVALQEMYATLRGMPEPLRAAIVFQKKWPAGRPITIRFLEGDPNIQNKVKEMAMDWTNYGNIKFQFVNDKQDADIQIAFQQGAGSWSYIGIDANTILPGEPTMNFGWFDENTPDKEFSRTTKHEFGHALGCIHEHQNPAGGINWNKEAVYKDLSGPPNNWDRETIDRNIFQRYSKAITQYTEVDPQSIMTYYFPAHWTIDHISFGENVFDLSDTDKKFIKEQYP
jgi:serralysin